MNNITAGNFLFSFIFFTYGGNIFSTKIKLNREIFVFTSINIFLVSFFIQIFTIYIQNCYGNFYILYVFSVNIINSNFNFVYFINF